MTGLEFFEVTSWRGENGSIPEPGEGQRMTDITTT